MAANSIGSCDSKLKFEKCTDRLKLLYPAVNEEETPLPRSWSPKDKYNYIGLSQNNLRVHYKGHGKTHKDAASVRATHPIPPSCGLYYFEVRIISKGRDGYMGIGLSGQTVNMNRLPGWDKHSYGYHGDDGHSFCSSGTGQPYGPTFTTGDIIGCGVNLIDNTAFYTKNGHNLGIAFTDLPPNLYPTVGLQTPGEVVDANFGQEPFVFDIEDMMNELKARIRNTIYNYPIPDTYGQWQSVLQKMVSTYLVHHGYCSTAEAFARGTGQAFDEEITSIKNRQRILKLVLNGKMSEAIETTSKIYLGLLEHNRNLLFMLKCRQFVEMVNGTDTEVCPPKCVPAASRNLSSPSSSPSQHPVSPQPTSVIQSTKSLNANNTTSGGTIMTTANNGTGTVNNSENGDNNDNDATSINNVHNINSRNNNCHNELIEEMNATNTLLNGANGVESSKNGVCDNDVEMISQPVSGSDTTATVATVTNIVQDSPADAESDNDTISKANSNSQLSPSQHHHYQVQSNNNSSNNNHHHFHHPQNHNHVHQQQQQNHYHNNHHAYHHNHNHNQSQQLSPSSASVIIRSAIPNGVANGYQNGAFTHEDSVEDMEIDPPSTNSSSVNGNVCDKKKLCSAGKPAVERVLEFGRELFLLSVQLRQELGKNETNKKMLQDAFSLLAYSNPWNSPVGWQLDPALRESVCATLNSAILESSNLARRPPLEVAVAHTTELITLMSHSGLGSCAFTNFDDLLH